MVNLINTYKYIEKREVLDCRIKSIKELVRNYGLNLNSYEVLLLCEAYSFNYNRIKIPGIPLDNLLYATVSHNDLETTFFQNLNISYQKKNISSSLQDWEYMKSLIDKNIPILFRIDSRFLNGSEDASPKQMKLNLYYLSTLLLVGYDEEKGEVFVVLTNSDEKEGVNKITLEEFQKYRFTTCIPFSPEGLCFYIMSHSDIGFFNHDDVKKAVLKSIKKTADNMLNEGKIYEDKMGTFTGIELRKGIYAMELLRNDLQYILEHYDSKDKDRHKIIQLKIIFLRNNMMFGSHTAFRREFGQSLKYCADQYGIQELYRVSEGFEEIARHWSSLFILLSGIAHATEDLSERLVMVIKVWDRIIFGEREQFTKIKEIQN